MAKGLTKTALIRAMAEKLEFTNKQTATFLDLLAETAVNRKPRRTVSSPFPALASS